jgi:hypothetical protein
VYLTRKESGLQTVMFDERSLGAVRMKCSNQNSHNYCLVIIAYRITLTRTSLSIEFIICLYGLFLKHPPKDSASEINKTEKVYPFIKPTFLRHSSRHTT